MGFVILSIPAFPRVSCFLQCEALSACPHPLQRLGEVRLADKGEMVFHFANGHAAVILNALHEDS